jgi:DnaJ-class molecular chaperone
MTFPRHYETLGVPQDATPAEIKAAFRRLAKEWHPDRNKRPDAAARFRTINEAYQCLIDPVERATYDAFLNRGGGGGGPWGSAYSPVPRPWWHEASAALAEAYAELEARLRPNPEKLVSLFTRIDLWLRAVYAEGARSKTR